MRANLPRSPSLFLSLSPPTGSVSLESPTVPLPLSFGGFCPRRCSLALLCSCLPTPQLSVRSQREDSQREDSEIQEHRPRGSSRLQTTLLADARCVARGEGCPPGQECTQGPRRVSGGLAAGGLCVSVDRAPATSPSLYVKCTARPVADSAR